ncbi:MAG TPA: GntR family transcriptional regulator [Pseudonocardiaceae bacterium]|jgi:DNA-binding GntR family transcriptional regulator|nr:GntR family transcriptional regulator [Pseudonocardiaceae bacterium]
MRSVEVVSALRADIVDGFFAQGQRLTEEQLSEHYGVSRIPIREALRILQSEGFVDVAPYRHTTVAVLGADEAADLLEVRAALEETAIRRAARLPVGELEHAREVLATGTAAVAAGHLDELPQLNTDLHTALVEVSGNTSLIAIHRLIRHKIHWVYASSTDCRAADSWREHEMIMAALLDRDSDLAAVLVRAHIAQSAAHYRQHLTAVQ